MDGQTKCKQPLCVLPLAFYPSHLEVTRNWVKEMEEEEEEGRSRIVDSAVRQAELTNISNNSGDERSKTAPRSACRGK